MRRTVLSLFAGFGGKTLGAIAAGYTPIGAIDYSESACDFYSQNIGAIDHINILDANPKDYDRPSILMASPPCTNHSDANHLACETIFDVALSCQVVTFAKVLKPPAIIVENVPPYRKSQSCLSLMGGLVALGYTVVAKTYNSADFGVPQARSRLIIRAAKRGVYLDDLRQTHCKPGDYEYKKWVGWYEAAADILPSLPDSDLLAHQKVAVAEVAKAQTCITQRVGYRGTTRVWLGHQPMGTILASWGRDHKDHKRTKFADVYWNRGDRFEVKRVTPHLLARLQGFPDGLWWSGDVRRDVAGIGNSVPPALAEAAVRSVRFE